MESFFVIQAYVNKRKRKVNTYTENIQAGVNVCASCSSYREKTVCSGQVRKIRFNSFASTSFLCTGKASSISFLLCPFWLNSIFFNRLNVNEFPISISF